MILRVEHRDRDGNSGSPARRAQELTLVAEGGTDLELLGRLAALLAGTGPTTSAAVRALVERPAPELPVP